MLLLSHFNYKGEWDRKKRREGGREKQARGFWGKVTLFSSSSVLLSRVKKVFYVHLLRVFYSPPSLLRFGLKEGNGREEKEKGQQKVSLSFLLVFFFFFFFFFSLSSSSSSSSYIWWTLSNQAKYYGEGEERGKHYYCFPTYYCSCTHAQKINGQRKEAGKERRREDGAAS